MRIFNFVLAVMFLVFAFLQINDPDPVIWILIYGVMAVTAVLAAFEFYSRKYLIGLLVIFALYSLTYISGLLEWLQLDDKSVLFDEMEKKDHLYIEESREFLGLMICVGVLVFYLIRSGKKK